MAERWTHTKCFDAFGVIPKNLRWSWSGRSLDGKTVAVTLWKDRFLDQGRVYKNHDSDVPGEWRSRPGFVELIDNLQHAAEHLDGVIGVIIAEPKDASASPRSIAKCYPRTNLKMRVTHLDPEEGKFILERL